jgi:hypothetical protein
MILFDSLRKDDPLAEASKLYFSQVMAEAVEF